MSWDGNTAYCDGCRNTCEFASGDVSMTREGDGDWRHYHQACWQTGWYTGIEPKGEWPIAPAEDPWPDEVGHGANDPVHSPAHYRWLPNGIEVIDITETLGFCLGNVIKYTLRADHKGKPIEDLKKAEYYLRREIANRKRDNGNDSA